MTSDDTFAYRPVRWPIIVGAAAIVGGLAMLAAGAWGFRYAAHIAQASASEGPSLTTQAAGPALDDAIAAPPVAMYLSDVRSLFKLAGEKRLALGAVEYRSEANASAGVLVKHVVLHVDDEYPKLKSFAAEMLRTMPHLQLEEIQMEQAAAPQLAAHVQATIKLALVYRERTVTGP